MFESYTVGVKFTLIDAITGPLAMMTRHLRASAGVAKDFQTQLSRIKGFGVAGGLLMGTGAALAAPLLYATDKAAELQKQLIAIQNATHGTTQQMNNLRGAIEKVAGVTVFSNIDVAKITKLIATGNSFSPAQVQSMVPVFTKFADVQLLQKGTPYAESVTNLIRLAHTAQHYDASSLTAYGDLLTKASMVFPGSLTELGHALKYSQGVGKTALGVSDENMIILTALGNRLGLSGSRGGTNLLAAMTRTIPGVFGSGLLTGKSNEALADMRMIDAAGHSKAFKNGKFDAVTWMGLMGEFVQREFNSHPEAIARQNIMKDFQHAFGTQGSKLASLFSSTTAIEQFKLIAAQVQSQGGTDEMQARFANESVSQQYTNALTNVTSAMTELGMTLLPTVTLALKKFNGEMNKLIDWMTKNPEKVKQYAKDLGYFSAAMVGLGAISIATSAALGLSAVIGGLGKVAMGAGAKAGAGGRFARAGQALAGGSLLLGTYDILNALIPDKPFGIDLGSWSGLWHSMSGHHAASRHSHIAPSNNQPVTVNVTVHNRLDKNGLATMVTQHQSSSLSKPQTGISMFDGRMGLVPAGSGY